MSQINAHDRAEEEKRVEIVRGLSKMGVNRDCFDCGQKGGGVVVLVKWGLFICLDCAGVHRSFSHKIKVIATYFFTEQEVELIRQNGNEKGAAYWLAKWDQNTYPRPSNSDPNSIRQWIQKVFENKTWVGSDVSQEKKSRSKPTSSVASSARPAPPLSAPIADPTAFSSMTFPPPASPPTAAFNLLNIGTSSASQQFHVRSSAPVPVVPSASASSVLDSIFVGMDNASASPSVPPALAAAVVPPLFPSSSMPVMAFGSGAPSSGAPRSLGAFPMPPVSNDPFASLSNPVFTPPSIFPQAPPASSVFPSQSKITQPSAAPRLPSAYSLLLASRVHHSTVSSGSSQPAKPGGWSSDLITGQTNKPGYKHEAPSKDAFAGLVTFNAASAPPPPASKPAAPAFSFSSGSASSSSSFFANNSSDDFFSSFLAPSSSSSSASSSFKF